MTYVQAFHASWQFIQPENENILKFLKNILTSCQPFCTFTLTFVLALHILIYAAWNIGNILKLLKNILASWQPYCTYTLTYILAIHASWKFIQLENENTLKLLKNVLTSCQSLCTYSTRWETSKHYMHPDCIYSLKLRTSWNYWQVDTLTTILHGYTLTYVLALKTSLTVPISHRTFQTDLNNHTVNILSIILYVQYTVRNVQALHAYWLHIQPETENILELLTSWYPDNHTARVHPDIRPSIKDIPDSHNIPQNISDWPQQSYCKYPRGLYVHIYMSTVRRTCWEFLKFRYLWWEPWNATPEGKKFQLPNVAGSRQPLYGTKTF